MNIFVRSSNLILKIKEQWQVCPLQLQNDFHLIFQWRGKQVEKIVVCLCSTHLI